MNIKSERTYTLVLTDQELDRLWDICEAVGSNTTSPKAIYEYLTEEDVRFAQFFSNNISAPCVNCD